MFKPLINPKIKQKVDALLSKMSLAQKVGQMTQAERMTCTPAEVKAFHLGSVFSGSGSFPMENEPSAWIKMSDAYWAASMEGDESHLAIPILYGVDAIHGHNNIDGATIFPHNIGLGAVNDEHLITKIGKVTARELMATGVDWNFAPVLAVAQDPRWGRTYESFSEDPTVVARCAAALINGLQTEQEKTAVLACAKHWVGEGATTNGIDQGDTQLSIEELERVHVHPYHAALDEGVLTIMASYTSWKGEKCHASDFLVSELLKGKIGFKGFVISDWEGVSYLSEDYYHAVKLGVNSGIDMFMVPESWQTFIEHLILNVKQGTVPLSRIDDAVRRILSVKFASGLFDQPRPTKRYWSNHECLGCSEHRKIACEAVRKSLVLLKNENDLLPLPKEARVLVGGKSSHNRGHQCGGFTLAWQGETGNDVIKGGTSIWEGIQALAPNASLSQDGTCHEVNPDLHDVVIVVIGEKPYAEGFGDIRTGDNLIVEAGSQINGQVRLMTPYGQSPRLCDLHPEDLEAIQTVARAGVPVVAVMLSGRPLVINEELATVQSFVAAWLPGSEGQGVAEVLFGDYDFEGKLSFSWPEDYSAAIKNKAKNMRILFPFGYGLRYPAKSKSKN